MVSGTSGAANHVSAAHQCHRRRSGGADGTALLCTETAEMSGFSVGSRVSYYKFN